MSGRTRSILLRFGRLSQQGNPICNIAVVATILCRYDGLHATQMRTIRGHTGEAVSLTQGTGKPGTMKRIMTILGWAARRGFVANASGGVGTGLFWNCVIGNCVIGKGVIGKGVIGKGAIGKGVIGTGVIGKVAVSAIALGLAVTAGIGLAAGSALAADSVYPTKPIHIVVGYTPGGSTDIPARLIGQKLGELLGQPVVIENRPGAGGNVAIEAVLRSAPDGYTLAWVSPGVTVAKALLPKLGYDLMTDLVPVSQATSAAGFLVVNPALPFKTVAEFVDYCKAHPGELHYGSSGTAGSPHLAAEWFKSIAGIDIIHVPYKGTSPQIVDLLSGVTKVGFPTMPGVIEYVKDGRLRALAVSSAQRSPLLPNTPTMIESGYPGYVATSWTGVMVPAGTPPAVVAKLSESMGKVLAMPEVRQRLLDNGAEAVSSTPDEFRVFLLGEIDKWTRVVREANIRID